MKDRSRTGQFLQAPVIKRVLQFFYWFKGAEFLYWFKGAEFLHVDGPKTEKTREPTVETSLVRGIWRLRVSEAERRVREGV